MNKENSIVVKPFSVGIVLTLTVLWAIYMIVKQEQLFPWQWFIVIWLIEMVIVVLVSSAILKRVK